MIAIRRGFRGLARDTDGRRYFTRRLTVFQVTFLSLPDDGAGGRPFPLVAALLLNDRLTFEDATVRIDPLARTNPGIFLLSQEIPEGRYASVRSVPVFHQLFRFGVPPNQARAMDRDTILLKRIRAP